MTPQNRIPYITGLCFLILASCQVKDSATNTQSSDAAQSSASPLSSAIAVGQSSGTPSSSEPMPQSAPAPSSSSSEESTPSSSAGEISSASSSSRDRPLSSTQPRSSSISSSATELVATPENLARWDSLCQAPLPVYPQIPVTTYSGERRSAPRELSQIGSNLNSRTLDPSGWIRIREMDPRSTFYPMVCTFQMYDVAKTLEHATHNLPIWRRQMDSLYRHDYCILANSPLGPVPVFTVYLSGVSTGIDSFNDSLSLHNAYPSHGGWMSIGSGYNEHPRHFASWIERGLPVLLEDPRALDQSWPCDSIPTDTSGWPTVTPQEFLNRFPVFTPYTTGQTP